MGILRLELQEPGRNRRQGKPVSYFRSEGDFGISGGLFAHAPSPALECFRCVSSSVRAGASRAEMRMITQGDGEDANDETRTRNRFGFRFIVSQLC